MGSGSVTTFIAVMYSCTSRTSDIIESESYQMISECNIHIIPRRISANINRPKYAFADILDFIICGITIKIATPNATDPNKHAHMNVNTLPIVSLTYIFLSAFGFFGFIFRRSSACVYVLKHSPHDTLCLHFGKYTMATAFEHNVHIAALLLFIIK